MKFRKHIFILLITLLVSGLVLNTTSFGAEVVMKSGERFQTSRIWEQDGKIRFNMQGLIVDVKKDDVAAVIQDRSQKISRSTEGQPANGIKTGAPTRNPHASSQGMLKESVPSEPSRPAAPTQAPNISDHGTGVQGIYWQMKPQEIAGMQKVETDPAFGGIDQYWRPDQSLQWGRVTLDGWVYGFWKDQLYSIMMWINGWSGYEKLRKQVITLFGPGSQNREDKECYVWIDPANQRMLEFDRKLGTGILIMRSSSVDAQIKKLYPNP